jgi:hypothetical protein
MSRNMLRRPSALVLLALLVSSPLLAAQPRSRTEPTKPATAAGSIWSVLVEMALGVVGLPVPTAADAQPQGDAGPTMDPLGR